MLESHVQSPVDTHCISVPEAARRLGVGLSLAKAMAADGRLPTIKLGARRVVPVAVLEELVSAKVAEARRLASGDLGR
jgi:excisionase family DNA binding protein